MGGHPDAPTPNCNSARSAASAAAVRYYVRTAAPRTTHRRTMSSTTKRAKQPGPRRGRGARPKSRGRAASRCLTCEKHSTETELANANCSLESLVHRALFVCRGSVIMITDLRIRRRVG
eukprot:COSAG01_NODE_18229_length_1091_cov_1.094758_2_plen_118_part_01